MNFRPPRSTRKWPPKRARRSGLDDQPMRLLGCSLSLLDIDERMIALLDKSPYCDRVLRHQAHSGAVCDRIHRGGSPTRRNIRTLRHFRGKLRRFDLGRRLRDLGWCPSLRNLVGSRIVWRRPTRLPDGAARLQPGGALRPSDPHPHQQRVPCHEVVQMDYFVPGCPPEADAILEVHGGSGQRTSRESAKSLNRFRLIGNGRYGENNRNRIRFTRIEGHGKVVIELDDDRNSSSTQSCTCGIPRL